MRDKLVTGGFVGDTFSHMGKDPASSFTVEIVEPDFYNFHSKSLEGVIRKAEEKDAAAIAKLFLTAYQGNYPYKKYEKPEGIQSLLNEPSLLWYVAELNGSIMGVTNTQLFPWNMSFDTGRTVIANEVRSLGLPYLISKASIESGFRAGHDLAWGRIRAYPIMRMVLDKFGYSLNGIKDGEQEVFGREVYLIGMRFSPSPRISISPPSSLFSENPFFKKLLAGFNISREEGPYPSQIVVSEGGSDEIIIQGAKNGVHNSFYIHDLFCSDQFDYLEMMVLADKTDFIHYMKRFGFSAGAFFPGWFLKDNKRYDCVLLQNSNTREITSQDSRFEAILKEVAVEIGYKPAGRLLEE